MKISNPFTVIDLPVGEFYIGRGDMVYEGTLSDNFVVDAAKVLKRNKDKGDYTTQAQIVEKAINKYKWGLGKSNYRAYTVLKSTDEA